MKTFIITVVGIILISSALYINKSYSCNNGYDYCYMVCENSSDKDRCMYDCLNCR